MRKYPTMKRRSLPEFIYGLRFPKEYWTLSASKARIRELRLDVSIIESYVTDTEYIFYVKDKKLFSSYRSAPVEEVYEYTSAPMTYRIGRVREEVVRNIADASGGLFSRNGVIDALNAIADG